MEKVQQKAVEYIKKQKNTYKDWLNKFKTQKNIEKEEYEKLEKLFLKEIKMFDYILAKLK